jgi:protein O-GlcNAc transferase
LLIKTFGLQELRLRASLMQQFERAGIGADRISIAAPIRNHCDHMEAYEEADVALDTFPYNGTTTTLDALWMGVPVITFAGDRHASRVGLSILSTIGLTEGIAKTPDQYVAAAVELVSDIDKLDLLHRSLGERLQSSPLMDGRGFAADLEDAYLKMFEEQ